MKKIGNLRSEITLLQHGFADKLIAAIYYGSLSSFRSNISGESPDLAATLLIRALHQRHLSCINRPLPDLSMLTVEQAGSKRKGGRALS
jgi:hypothetical protein